MGPGARPGADVLERGGAGVVVLTQRGGRGVVAALWVVATLWAMAMDGVVGALRAVAALRAVRVAGLCGGAVLASLILLPDGGGLVSCAGVACKMAGVSEGARCQEAESSE
jgi:hypothetical protein